MRLWFSLFLFIASVAYFIYGWNTLRFVTHIGRPGPGYFPAIVGGMLIIFTGWNLVKDVISARNGHLSPFNAVAVFKQNRFFSTPHDNDRQVDFHQPVDVFVTIACIVLLISSMHLLGGLLAMMVFMLVLLSFFKWEGWRVNVIYSFLLPISLYMLFDVLLNASLPRGIFGI